MRTTWARVVVAALVVVAFAGLGSVGSPAGAAAPAPGYWLLGGDGGVFSFDAPFFGAAASEPAKCAPNTADRQLTDGTCVSVASTPSGRGYWILNGDTGAVYAYGDAQLFGQPADGFAGVPREFVPAGRAIVSSRDGQGYWVLETGASGAGTVLHFGDAGGFGDTATLARISGRGFDGQPVGIAATPDGNGYWEVHDDGGVFAFGDAGYYGSMGGRLLAQPVVGIAVTATGKGYWLVAADGGVFAFGDAVFAGSTGALRLAAPVVGMARNPSGSGYWLAASDGGVFSFGGAPFLGSTGGIRLARPIFSIAARRIAAVG
ncbi:MAG: Esterase [Actinomycetia bacterium]|nr:Esterase [Actinomycetes bacterium]